MYPKVIAATGTQHTARDQGPILLIVILNLLFVLSIVYNAVHQGVPTLEGFVPSGL